MFFMELKCWLAPTLDLVLEENPCHEEALEVALMAGVDFIVNVTLDRDFALTDLAGDLEVAHQQAVERIRSTSPFPLKMSMT